MFYHRTLRGQIAYKMRHVKYISENILMESYIIPISLLLGQWFSEEQSKRILEKKNIWSLSPVHHVLITSCRDTWPLA